MYDKEKEIFRDRIRIIRESADLTQEEAAKKLGVSVQTIKIWETKGTIPMGEQLICISKFYNVDINWLFGMKSGVDLLLKDKVTKIMRLLGEIVEE